MDPALLVLRIFPPPPAGPGVLAWLDGARARGAADRREAAVVERVNRDVVLVGVGADLFHRPANERVQLDDAAVDAIDLDLGRARAGHRLLGPTAGDPGIEPGEGAGE